MYFWWYVLVIKSTERNPEGRMLSNVFRKKENNPPKERQHRSFRNSRCGKKKKKSIQKRTVLWLKGNAEVRIPASTEGRKPRTLGKQLQAGYWHKELWTALPGRRAMCLPLERSEDRPASSWHRDLDFVEVLTTNLCLQLDSWEAFYVRHRPRLTPASSHWASICQTLRCLGIIREVYFKSSMLGLVHQRLTTFGLVPRNWHC